MKLQQLDRLAKIARAKWTSAIVLVPDQAPRDAQTQLAAIRHHAKQRGERVKVEYRTIRAGGLFIPAMVVLIGPKTPPLPVWIGHLEMDVSFEILTATPGDTSKKREMLAHDPPDLGVRGRASWPAWLLAVEDRSTG